MHQTKIGAGETFPEIAWPTVAGDTLNPAAQSGWRMLVVYRGRHCPICKTYLRTLNELLPEFSAAQVAVAAVSADPVEKARADVEQHGWTFPVGYDIQPDQMRMLGLYISNPTSPKETNHQFPEPGLFVINPEGRVQIVDVSNAPFARPDLKLILSGLNFVIAHQYPIRGDA